MLITFAKKKNIPHEGVFRDGQIVEIYQNKMVSERSEFHFVISTISPSAPEPGRFWLLLLFLYLLSHGRRKERRFWFFFKKKTPTSHLGEEGVGG